MENWKDIEDWVGRYQVSDLGNVRSLDQKIIDKAGRNREIKGRIKKPTPNKSRGGYLYVTLQSRVTGVLRTRSVHRLVAEAFLYPDNDDETLIVDHINGDRTDNRLSNLQLITYRENTHKGNLNGNTSKHMGVCWHKLNNKWMASLYHNKKQHHLGYFHSEIDAKKAYDEKLKEINNG